MKMRNGFYYVLGLSFFVSLVVAQTLPRTTPAKPQRGYVSLSSTAVTVSRNSRVNGRNYVSILKQTTNSPAWDSAAPLPLSFSSAEQIARGELRKIVSDESDWVADDFQIRRFAGALSWYYAVTLQPALQLTGERSDSFTVLVDFSGTPGRVLESVLNESGPGRQGD